ncbi:MAG: Eco57I restriction-modification methylase domain-containing protein, partial [Candidatus Heimdallarchaeaceae archaeon]
MDSKKEIDIKKQLGAFYTPQPIVDFMVSRAFDFLEKKKKISLKSKKQFTDSLFSLKILDPAVGTGRFIEGIIRNIKYNLKKLGFETKHKEELIAEFVSNNLFGIEIDLPALKKCKSNLTIKYPFLKESHLKQLKIGNSLVEPDIYKMFEDENSSLLSPFSWKEEFQNTKFDLIIGNPPYFSFRKLGLEKIENRLLYNYLKISDYWKDYFRSSADIYFYFIVKSLNYLERKGVLSFIVPSYWITNHFADKLREKILNYKILEIIDFQNQKVFGNAGKRINVSSTILSVINEVPT